MTPLARKRQFLAPFGCCLTGRIDCDLCHLHEGQWTSNNQKVPDSLTLPMSRLVHEAQHKHPLEFWPNALPGADPKWYAVRLDDLYQQRDLEGVELLFMDMRGRADRSYLARFLVRAV